MTRASLGFVFALAVAAALPSPDASPALYAQAPACSLTGYKAAPGLSAAVAGDALSLTWDGDANQEVRMQLTVNSGTPTIKDLSVRRKGGTWASVASNATPEFTVVSGFRRATDQQIKPLQDLKVDITPEVIDRIKWEAFWDAPLNIPGDEVAHGGSTPPVAGIANQPGLPRKPEEVKRGEAIYQVKSCEVTSAGGRITVSYPGVKLGVFDGRLEFTVYKGTNLVRQAIVAKTEERSVAYKYDAGLKGLTIQPASRVVWRDTSNLWQENRLGGAKNDKLVALKAANRLVVAEGPGGSIAAFPPPHRFFWARETEFNLGYNWYRKDSPTSFAIRHPPGREGRTAARRRTRARRHQPELRALQRAARHLAADAGVLLRQRRSRPGDDAVRARLHARGSLQADSRLPGDGDALPHQHRAAAARDGRARREAARLRGGARHRHQHLRAD